LATSAHAVPAAPPIATGHADHGHAHHPGLAHHFDDLEQQRDTAVYGMWAFLVQEVMFFGGLFLAYIVYRNLYPDAFAHASNMLNVELGFANTLVLLASSLTMAWAVRGGATGSKITQLGMLALTIVFGLAFLVVKYFEYAQKFEHHLVPGPTFDPTFGPHGSAWFMAHPEEIAHAKIFFFLYFAMTGVHAAHMVVGAGLMLWIMKRAKEGEFVPEHHDALEMSGLYWHFVDIVWIFLFPMIYLLGAHFGGHH
jgi:cytochrome c oxidase subunit III